ncbi:MAG: extracellular solute-binding protein [Alicyclobacillus sp.]|nr:extracellular solute-binding protein [Alicyclobacillus sp.]
MKGKKATKAAVAVMGSMALTIGTLGSTAMAHSGHPVVKILENWANINYNTYPVALYLREATGFNVQYDMLPQDGTAAQNKLNLIMSSGADYDLIETGSQQMAYFAQNGALTDLTPLINKYGPNIKQAISKEGWNAATINGKIYAIPTKNVSYVGSGILIRADWLQKLHLKMPHTLSDLVNVLEQFKSKDPGHNGSANIAFTIAGGSPFAADIQGAFGLYNSWNLVKGKLVNVADDPRTAQYLSFMHSLYQQGLLDKEFATNQSATADQKFTSGRAGAYAVGWWEIPALIQALKQNDPHANIAYIPPLQGSNGQIGYGVNEGYANFYVVPKSAKDPVDAIKFVNAELDPKVFKEMYIGQEGVDYKVVKGKYVPIQPAFFDDRGYASNYTIGMDEKHFYKYWLARVQKDATMYKGFQQLNNIPAKDKHPDVSGLAPYIPDYANNAQQLSNMLTDFAVTAIANGVDAKSFASFSQQWDAAGGANVTKELNAWYASRK